MKALADAMFVAADVRLFAINANAFRAKKEEHPLSDSFTYTVCIAHKFEGRLKTDD